MELFEVAILEEKTITVKGKEKEQVKLIWGPKALVAKSAKRAEFMALQAMKDLDKYDADDLEVLVRRFLRR